MNKTPISSVTNRFISAKAPSRYVDELALRAQISPEEMRESLMAHHIGVSHLLVDDFDAFFEDRRLRLLDLVGSAMGKPVLSYDQAGPDDFGPVEEDELNDLAASLST